MKRAKGPDSSPSTPQNKKVRITSQATISQTTQIVEAVHSDLAPAGGPPAGMSSGHGHGHGREEEGEGWTKVEKRKQKKAKKAEVKLDAAQPRFMYSNGEITKRHHAIGIEEIRELVLHLIADAPPPNWLRIDNAHLITKVVALLVPGITPELISLPPIPSSAFVNPNLPQGIPLPSRAITPTASGTAMGLSPGMPFVASTFSHACPTRAPGDQMRMHSALSTFFNGPISAEEKKKRIAQRLASEQGNIKDPMQYRLTLEQMIENDYPIPSYMADVFEKPEGWIETPEPAVTQQGEGRKIYAIDCEMCLTEAGKELARVCVIDFHTGQVVYDQLVKPSMPVVDYLTRWSGITEEALAPITTTLSQVQEGILALLTSPPTPLLLGHSLESDLKALKLCHPLCIDTAVIYHHPRGRPLKPGLAWLTKKWCNREIQTRGEGGHDPEEDARACLELLQKKLDGGPGFGEFKTDYESIFERMTKSTRRVGGVVGGIKSAVVDHGNPSMMHGNKATTAIGCTNDEEVLQGLLNVMPSHHFTYGRFLSLANILGWTTPKASADGPPPEPVPEPTPETMANTLVALNSYLKNVHAALPSRTALIIFTGHSDPRRMAALNSRKNAFESAMRAGKAAQDLEPEARWTTQDARDLEEAVEIARRGLLFLGIKS
ncbi:hypothetical protein AX16_008267 [Volvariella volvacea WC 439]|nr:hypothetical protein AX16_008267 [Volvariella volvacea WC 439]